MKDAFKLNTDNNTKGLPLGLIVDGDIHDKKFDSVQGGHNIDYYGPIIKKRDALEIVKSSIPVASGYTVFKIQEKKITDKDGTDTIVYYAFASHATSPIKIYVSNWYNPAYTGTESGKVHYYTNAQSQATGWTVAWTELTEYYSDIAVSATDMQYGKYYGSAEVTGLVSINVNTTDATLLAIGSVENYFRGFFAYHQAAPAGAYRSLGIITGSKVENAGTLTLYIRCNLKVDTNALVYELLAAAMNALKICRYPFLKEWDSYTGITDVSIVNLPNQSILCTFGNTLDPISIGFIPNKKFFPYNTNIGDHTAKTGIAYTGVGTTGTTTFDVGMADTSQLLKEDFIQFHSVGNANLNHRVFQIYDINPNVTVSCRKLAGFNSEDMQAGTVDVVNTKLFYGQNWDGYWLAKMTPEVTEIDKWWMVNNDDTAVYFDYAEEDLGLIIGFISEVVTAAVTSNNVLLGFLAEVDMQPIFLKMAATERKDVTDFTSIYEKIVFKYDFDRRINSIKGFMKVSDVEHYVDTNAIGSGASGEAKPEALDTQPYQLSKAHGGNTTVEEVKLEPTITDPYYVSSMYNLAVTVPAIESSLYGNNGENLNTYLGRYYYRPPNLKCNGFNYINGYVMAYGLAEESLLSNPINKNCIAVSCLQQGTVPTTICFSAERLIEIESEVKAIVFLYNNRFAFWTDYTFYIHKLNNIIAIDSEEIYRKIEAGIVSKNSYVVARVKDEFGGLYWLSNDEFYRFTDGKPDPLTLFRIQDLIKAIASKSSVLVAYHPEEQEIWLLVSYSEVYVYNILYDNWKLYKLPNKTYFQLCQSINGYLLLTDGTNIYKKEKDNTQIADFTSLTTGSNLVTNGTFENDFNSWTSVIDGGGSPCGTITIDATGGVAGTKAVKFLRNVDLSGNMKLYQSINCDALSTYELHYSIKHAVYLYGIYIVVKDQQSNILYQALPSLVTAYTETIAEFTTLAGSTSFTIELWDLANNFATNQNYLDNIECYKITEVSTPITLDITKYVNDGSSESYKLFDRVEMILSLVQSIATNGGITISVYDHNDVLIQTRDYTTAPSKINFGTRKRISAKYFKLIIESKNAGDITSLKIHQLTFFDYFRKKQITK